MLVTLWVAIGQGLAQDLVLSPIKVTLCDLAEHPERYAGRMVVVRASEIGPEFGIEDFTNKACSSYTPVVVVFPDQVEPTPGFGLVRDEAFNKFFEEVRKGKHVEATYEGRFDVAYVWRDHKLIYVGSGKGYGKNYKYGARIVLHRLSDVVSHSVTNK